MIHDEEAAKIFVRARCAHDSMMKIEQFVTLLSDENQRQNLVASATIPHVWLRHVADSIQLLDHVSRETGIWLDLGSGAGFPGLMIAAARPHLSVKLVESRRLRIEWLRRAVDEMKLLNCEVVGCDLKSVPTFPAAVISARAFAPIKRLIGLSARFSTSQTVWVLPKGRNASQDIAMLDAHQRELFHVKPSQTDIEAGIVVGTGRLEIVP